MYNCHTFFVNNFYRMSLYSIFWLVILSAFLADTMVESLSIERDHMSKLDGRHHFFKDHNDINVQNYTFV